MKIYNLDNIITSSALSLYKPTWVKLDLISCAKFIIKGTDFTFDWDEGIENWIVFFHKNKVIGYLCAKLPFAILDNEQLKNQLYHKYPHVLTLQIKNIETEKISLNVNICRLTLCPSFHDEHDTLVCSVQDFYVNTV